MTFPIGVRVFPVKGHEITGWYVHRRVVNSGLLDRAFIVGTDPGFNGHIRKALYNEFGGFWRWTLNPTLISAWRATSRSRTAGIATWDA